MLGRCDAVVCHGGSGTTLAALHAGLPLIIVPQGADQFENASACEKSGTARVQRPGGVESAAIRDAVLAVIATQSSERSAARAVAAEIAAMPAAFDATGVLETLTQPDRE